MGNSVNQQTLQGLFKVSCEPICRCHTLADPSNDWSSTPSINTCIQLTTSRICQNFDKCDHLDQPTAVFLTDSDEPDEPDTTPLFFCCDHFERVCRHRMCPCKRFPAEQGATCLRCKLTCKSCASANNKACLSLMLSR